MIFENIHFLKCIKFENIEISKKLFKNKKEKENLKNK